MKPRMLDASHALTALREEMVAAQEQAWQRPAAAPAPRPSPPPSKPAPAKKPAPPKKPPKQPARRAATPPVVQPGGLILSPDEVAALDRLLATHPALKNRETF